MSHEAAGTIQPTHRKRSTARLLAVAFGGYLVGRHVKAHFDARDVEVVLSEANRRRLVEEMASIVQSSLPPLIRQTAQERRAEPRGVGSLDEWYATRSTIPAVRVAGSTRSDES